MMLRTYGRTTLGVWPPPVVAAIRDRQSFTTGGSLRGEAGTVPSYVRTGRLEGAALDQWRNDRPYVDYCVWSYGTPIGWHCHGPGLERWVTNVDSYSHTTTRHQGLVQLAISLAY